MKKINTDKSNNFNQRNGVSSVKSTVESLFFLCIVLQIVSLSSFPLVFGKLGASSMTLILASSCLAGTLLFTVKNLKQIILFGLIVAVLMANYFLRPVLSTANQLISQVIIIFAVCSAEINFYKVVKIHLSALTSATIIIVMLSFFGFLPKSGQATTVLFSSYQNIVYSYGFNHPNFLGAILIFIGMELLFLNWAKKNSFGISLIFITLVFITIYIGANTAAIGGGLFFIGYLFRNGMGRLLLNALRVASYGLPILLAGFALWLANTPYTEIWQLTNKYVTSRPALWTYYISTFPTKLIGSAVQVVTSGINTSFGNGILDGSYIYQLMYNGWIFLFLFVVAIMAISFSAKIAQSNAFIFLAICIAIIAFSENEASNVVLDIFIIVIGYYQFPKNKVQALLGNKNLASEVENER